MVLLSRVIYTVTLLPLSLAKFKAFSFRIMKLDVFVPRDVPLVCRDTGVGKARRADSFIHRLLLNTHSVWSYYVCCTLDNGL